MRGSPPARDAAVEVVGQAGDADDLLREVRSPAPDAAVVDIRMPPAHTDEGLVAAQRIRAEHSAVAVLVLSHDIAPSYAMQLPGMMSTEAFRGDPESSPDGNISRARNGMPSNDVELGTSVASVESADIESGDVHNRRATPIQITDHLANGWAHEEAVA